MDEIRVVSRNAIPPIQALDLPGATREFGELRDFRWHALLRDFMPVASGFAVSWLRLKQGEALAPRAHVVQSLMVFYAGGGTLLGDLEGPVVKDDVVFVPAGCRYGCVGGQDGLHALSIQLGDGLGAAIDVAVADPQDSFSALMAYNQRRLEEFERRPLFELLADRTLEDPMKRKVLIDSVQVWLDGQQALLLARQACCSDPKYAAPFLQDLHEQRELTQSRSARGSGVRSSGIEHDPALEAMSNWFAYQMFVLDNAEKAAVQVASKAAIAAYASVANPLLAQYSSQPYDHLKHVVTGSELLRNQSPRTYARLRTILGETWDMLSAVTDRVVELTLQA